MGRKVKYTYEEKLKVCEEYLSGENSAAEIARKLQMGKNGERTVRYWIKQYQASTTKKCVCDQ